MLLGGRMTACTLQPDPPPFNCVFAAYSLASHLHLQLSSFSPVKWSLWPHRLLRGMCEVKRIWYLGMCSRHTSFHAQLGHVAEFSVEIPPSFIPSLGSPSASVLWNPDSGVIPLVILKFSSLMTFTSFPFLKKSGVLGRPHGCLPNSHPQRAPRLWGMRRGRRQATKVVLPRQWGPCGRGSRVAWEWCEEQRTPTQERSEDGNGP